MSYAILYRPMFIKCNKGFIPMVESGDNNVWEYGNKRRARSWDGLHLGKKDVFYSENDIKEYLADKISEYGKKYPEDIKGDNYGWEYGVAVAPKHTTKTTFSDVRRFYLSGLKTSVPFDFALKVASFKLNCYKSPDYSWDSKKTFDIKDEEMMYFLIEENKKNGYDMFNITCSSYGMERLCNIIDIMHKSASLKSKNKRVFCSPSKVVMIDDDKKRCYLSFKNNVVSATDNVEDAHIVNKVCIRVNGKLRNTFDAIFYDVIENLFSGKYMEFHSEGV